ncbi:DUF4198 domain-containing protein [Novosphingobium sp. KACC 22771]|uniref:DUF4198 domain-containing protein n=1 Tax=Novosphingobium sp. KACC 22771 TaxID=3025670 RepID=UPI0023663161|nr:DUF4198 domain-containing protein [Novosphingobium sp. KACC 22771]WDF73883.1 DUF4198 domain-containing protein [Novosphingobium sp. KACC 22771]
MANSMTFKSIALLVGASALALPMSAAAHRQWLLPVATTYSGDDPWASVDAAISNDLFFPDHFPLPLAQIKVTAPDGTPGAIEHGITARYRSTFDVHLTQPGTWKIGTESFNVMGSFKVDGVEKRVGRRPGPPPGAMGPGGAPGGAPGGRPQIESVALDAIPANATDLKLTEAISRNEIFITRGAPTTTLFKPTGKGLEFDPLTHPDDLVANEPGKFRFLIDGQSAKGLKLTVIPGGKRYRDAEGGYDVTTDANGVATVKWNGAGMYWMTISATDNHPATPRATERRMTYTATVEVMAP